MERNLIGIDVGGTSIKFGIVSDSGKLLYKWSIPTDKRNAGAAIIDDIFTSLQSALTKYSIDKKTIIGIGVGIPGFINNQSGLVYEMVNIGLKDFQFKQELEKRMNIPVHIENDANVAVLGENWQGAGNKAKHIIAVTLGTGVGGGIISNGKILNGKNGMAGELGHILAEDPGIRCNCGNYGCLETVASATGIVRQATEKLSFYPCSSLTKVNESQQGISAKDVFDHAEQGDRLANEVIEYTTEVLARTFADLGLILNPEKILIGGGVSKAGVPLLHRIQSSFKKVAHNRVQEACEIKLARLGNDAGIIGAAYIAKQNNVDISF